ncbi:MAG: class I SAM-dependent methyltransferase [Solirubrobacterales bacterium]|nr:class I SAM-dependent methyltransferase [Solirubrobacterales bacterium]
MSSIRDYYRSSSDYRTMLDAQDEAIFAPYVALFRAHADPGMPVIDVGCGVGTSTRLLRNAGFDAIGTDVSERFLPEGEEGFVVTDFESAPEIHTGAYAAAGALNVIEHMEHPRRFLTELTRVVRPGGHVILLSPNLTSPLAGIRAMHDLTSGAAPYLAVRNKREASTLVVLNLARSIRTALGHDAFQRREPRLDVAMSGYDADAVYWSNAAEVRRFLEGRGCRIIVFQGTGRTRAARLIARWLPSFAGQLRIVAQKPAV